MLPMMSVVLDAGEQQSFDNVPEVTPGRSPTIQPGQPASHDSRNPLSTKLIDFATMSSILTPTISLMDRRRLDTDFVSPSPRGSAGVVPIPEQATLQTQTSFSRPRPTAERAALAGRRAKIDHLDCPPILSGSTASRSGSGLHGSRWNARTVTLGGSPVQNLQPDTRRMFSIRTSALGQASLTFAEKILVWTSSTAITRKR